MHNKEIMCPSFEYCISEITQGIKFDAEDNLSKKLISFHTAPT
jgi:hypothetical protein